MIQLQAIPITLDAAAGDESPRSITGVAVPWSPVSAVVSSGEKVSFKRGAFDLQSKPKLLENHDMGQLRGVITELADSESGLLFEAKFAKTRAADDAIELVKAGAYSAVSVGAIPVKYKYDASGTMVVSEARIVEISLVAMPAFESAQITEIAAEAPEAEAAEAPQEDTNEGENSVSEPSTTIEAQVETVPTVPFVAAMRREPKLPTVAEWICATVTGNERILEAAGQVSGDTPGIIPEDLVGGVFSTLNNRRPFVSAIGTFAMPPGEIFYRRKVTQSTLVDVQEDELDDLASQKMTVERIPVTKQSVGGFIDLSEQSIDWSTPSALEATVRDMTNVYAKKTEQLACAALNAGATEGSEVTDWTDGDEILDKLFDGAAAIDGEIDELPTHLFLSPDIWASLGKAKYANGDRLLTQVGPSNVAGVAVPSSFNVAGLGLTVVVSNKFAATTAVLGNPIGIELYEQNKGLVTVSQPANMSVRLATRGYWASLVIEPGAFYNIGTLPA